MVYGLALTGGSLNCLGGIGCPESEGWAAAGCGVRGFGFGTDMSRHQFQKMEYLAADYGNGPSEIDP